MSAINKADAFIAEAEKNGWICEWRAGNNYGWVEVTAKRGPEKLVIEWNSNQLTGPPLYTLHEITWKLHSAKVAKQTVSRVKPDLDAYQRRQRAAQLAQRRQAVQPTKSSNGSGPTTNGSIPEPPVPAGAIIPFDIYEDSNATILKAIRGSTLVWKNQFTGMTEREFVPHLVGNKLYNRDLDNTFYLALGDKDRAYVSFMNTNGKFRAVYLDQLVAVL